MILVSFGVLLVAIALLIVGLVRQSAGVIWAAIGSSVISAVVLAVATRMTGPQARAGEADADAAAPALSEPTAAETAPETAPEATAPGATAPPATTPAPPVSGLGDMSGVDAEDALAGLDADALMSLWESERTHGQRQEVLVRIESRYLETGDMPIEGYTGASVSSLQPLLADLLPPELKAVRAFEAGGLNREPILAEIDRLLAGAPAE